jgi:phospholipid/cholesterol/gamma-HCH transport system permease protein
MLMELGPVLTALVLAGRVGSGIAAEVASMRVTEQIDAMRAMATNPIKKLSSTRFLAGMIIVPLLTYISILSGILGGMIVAVLNLGISLPFYKQSVFRMMMMRDVFVGFVKPFFFGFIIITVGAFVGFTSEGGTEGVGKSTTKSVVISSILVLVGDYFLTKVLLMILY